MIKNNSRALGASIQFSGISVQLVNLDYTKGGRSLFAIEIGTTRNTRPELTGEGSKNKYATTVKLGSINKG